MAGIGATVLLLAAGYACIPHLGGSKTFIEKRCPHVCDGSDALQVVMKNEEMAKVIKLRMVNTLELLRLESAARKIEASVSLVGAAILSHRKRLFFSKYC